MTFVRTQKSSLEKAQQHRLECEHNICVSRRCRVYSQVPNTSNVTIIYNLAKGTPLRPYQGVTIINFWDFWPPLLLFSYQILAIPSVTFIWVLQLLIFGQRGHRYFYLDHYFYSAPESRLQFRFHRLHNLGPEQRSGFPLVVL